MSGTDVSPPQFRHALLLSLYISHPRVVIPRSIKTVAAHLAVVWNLVPTYFVIDAAVFGVLEVVECGIFCHSLLEQLLERLANVGILVVTNLCTLRGSFGHNGCSGAR